MKSRKCAGVILKLDFEKAFDSVNWEFLLHLLQKLNFHSLWIRWLEGILNSARISVLINGSPSREFIPERGLRQGDPLSPLLFNLVGEVLHCMLSKAERVGLFQGVNLGNNGDTVSHLQYADDTVLFIRDDTESIKGIKRVLIAFELLSGLKINFAKSKLYGHNSSREDLQSWAEEIGCQIGFDSFNYLGLDLARSPYNIQFWDPLVSRVRNKLSEWKSKAISLAGKVVLLQAVLDSLPIYWFNMFLIPRAVENNLEKIRRSFFWGSKEVDGIERRGMHLLAWDKVCSPKSAGGVGITKIKERNIAMLGKWWWRFINERDKFWNITLQKKYGSVIGQGPSSVKIDRSSSYTIKSLLKIHQSGWARDLLSDGFIWKIKNGRTVRFWEDLWYGNKPFQKEFSRLFYLSNLKTASVRLIWEIWNAWGGLPVIIWSRHLRAWEEEQVNILNQILACINFEDGPDVLFWKWSGRCFSSKDLYMALTGGHMASPEYSSYWKLKVPPKVLFFLGKLVHHILPTKSFLAHRLRNMGFSATCSWCSAAEETLTHLFLECEVAVWCWGYVWGSWSIPSRRVNQSVFSLQSILGMISEGGFSETWQIVVAATLWSIWLFRNALVFSNNRAEKEGVLGTLRTRIIKWLEASSILSNGMDRLFWVNPMGAVKLSLVHQCDSFWREVRSSYDWVAATDGAVSRLKNMQPKSGIGGVIRSKEGRLEFIFSGPSNAGSVFDVELEACMHVVSKLKGKIQEGFKIIVCSDSTEVVNHMNKLKNSVEEADERQSDITQLVKSVTFKAISRKFNGEADGLAKEGIKRQVIVEGWV
ncbi:uncharacterized protein LOC108212453 [Daucus carota subsp. sativus]|uniref:uncharacterized protein LOC108212453 n=1 Tax=Daucus carota subsp. sativus TaxID=79200 RepID=UPI0007EFA321|nr:PREDICTED: uncharacterized protein LOC108212453 [Daucus carota subsp. sativus]